MEPHTSYKKYQAERIFVIGPCVELESYLPRDWGPPSKSFLAESKVKSREGPGPQALPGPHKVVLSMSVSHICLPRSNKSRKNTVLARERGSVHSAELDNVSPTLFPSPLDLLQV